MYNFVINNNNDNNICLRIMTKSLNKIHVFTMMNKKFPHKKLVCYKTEMTPMYNIWKYILKQYETNVKRFINYIKYFNKCINMLNNSKLKKFFYEYLLNIIVCFIKY